MNLDDDAAEFRTFVDMSDTDARDQAAFATFASNIRSAVQCAVLSNTSDGGERGGAFEEMQRAIAELLYDLLPRLPLAAVLANADGIGYTIRYGILEPRKGALDHIQTVEQLEDLAGRGHAADQMEIDRRMDELESGNL